MEQSIAQGIGSVCWLRRDLRVRDNRALYMALEAAATRGRKALVVFVFDTDILDALPDPDDRRVVFLTESVKAVDARLREEGGALCVLRGSARIEIPRLVESIGSGVAVYASHDFEPFGTARDAVVGQKLMHMDSSLVLSKDHVVFEKNELLTGSGTPFRVFTPYLKAWRSSLELDPERHLPLWPSADLLPHLAGSDEISSRGLAVEDASGAAPTGPSTLAGGETAARARLDKTLGRLADYDRARDFPSIEGTSRLSVDLRFGTVSIRDAVRTARNSSGDGARKWLDELVWREFYQMLLWHFPSTVDQPFQERTAGVVWDDPSTEPLAKERFSAWCEGRTGYPFVDAAMRELRATGWMHNRCRMVVASFLTKDLHIHWKRGERWFARWLLDIELASNVGGWQWAASTGADGQPWFRIFHPVLQSRAWDPQGRWIRRWCPELAKLDDKEVHAPWEAAPQALRDAGIVLGLDWPLPVVDHAKERRESLERFDRRG